MSNETEAAACIRCGTPAPAHGEHHAVEKGDGTTGPVGMGGSSLDHEHERVVLCRKCHTDVHDKKFSIHRNSDGLVACIDAHGKMLSIRALRETEDGVDEWTPGTVKSSMKYLLHLSDAGLAYIWEATDVDVYRALVKRSLVAYAFHKRYGEYGERWYERVAEVIRDQSGVPISTRAVYRAKAIGEVLVQLDGNPVQQAQIMGIKVLTALGEANNADAVEFAINARDNGDRMTEVAKHVRAKWGRKRKDGPPRCEETGTHVCKFCGTELEEV